jgi:hypothetical protein
MDACYGKEPLSPETEARLNQEGMRLIWDPMTAQYHREDILGIGKENTPTVNTQAVDYAVNPDIYIVSWNQVLQGYPKKRETTKA